MDYSNLFVCLMGICTVFIGLICIIVLVSVMSNIVRKTDKAMTKADASKNYDPAKATEELIHPSHVPDTLTAEIVAAVSAAIAEELGTDVSAIRIVSFKKVG